MTFPLFVEFENFRLIHFPRQDEVLYRKCVRGSVPTGKDKCCPEKDYDLNTGECKANECTTNPKHWLQMPVCRQSHKGVIQSYGTQASCVTAREYFDNAGVNPEPANAGSLTLGEYLSTTSQTEMNLCGEGLPCTKLQTKEPVPNLSLYNNMLITLKGTPTSGSQSFGIYVHHKRPYLVAPLERFNEFDHVLLPLDSGTWFQLQYQGRPFPQTGSVTGWDRIEDQKWYTKFNPLEQYNGQLLRRADQVTGNGAWAFIYGGKAYALWGNDCSLQKVTPVTIVASNTITDLLPTGSTFHHFSLAYKQPWYNDLLPDCETNQQVLAHF